MKYEKFFREFLGRDIPEHPPTDVQIVCPFHPDTQPSLRLNKASGKWKCSGCKQAGSAVHFLGLFEKVDYAEAWACSFDRRSPPFV
jgi:hypothetical protein